MREETKGPPEYLIPPLLNVSVVPGERLNLKKNKKNQKNQEFGFPRVCGKVKIGGSALAFGGLRIDGTSERNESLES